MYICIRTHIYDMVYIYKYSYVYSVVIYIPEYSKFVSSLYSRKKSKSITSNALSIRWFKNSAILIIKATLATLKI